MSCVGAALLCCYQLRMYPISPQHSSATMRNMTPSLSAQRIAALCNAAARSIALEVVPETGSTNADLLARLNRLQGPLLLVAEKQTAGRGRAGRSWLSAPGASLTFSLAWKFNRPLQALAGLPLAVGVALAQVLQQFDVRVALKWPNDVMKEGKKLAGVLIESAAVERQADGRDPAIWAVIGIGLNLAMPDQLEAQIGRPVAAATWLAQLDRNILMAAMLDVLTETLQQFERDGFQAFVTRWNALHAHAGQAVVIVDRGAVLHQGIAQGVDEMGRLLLDGSNGRIAVLAGDVSLRMDRTPA